MFNYTYWGNSSFPGNINMALEEYFVKLAAKEKTPSIRFFTFDKDTIVLSYGQATDALKNLDSNVELTRRLTGGSHVHNGPNILAYMFAIPRDGSFKNLTDMRAYYADIVGHAFQNLGINNVEVDNEACGVKIDEKVVASHAIFWGVESALLHGLVVLKPFDVEKIADSIWLKSRKIGKKFYTEESALRNIPVIMNQLKNFAPNANPEQKLHAVNELVAQEILKEATRNKYTKKTIDDKIISNLKPLLQEKYDKESWVIGRNPVFTKEEVEEIPGEELNGKLKERSEDVV